MRGWPYVGWVAFDAAVLMSARLIVTARRTKNDRPTVNVPTFRTARQQGGSKRSGSRNSQGPKAPGAWGLGAAGIWVGAGRGHWNMRSASTDTGPRGVSGRRASSALADARASQRKASL